MEKNETIPLDDRGFIQIDGEDREDFLQNIVTNDLKKIDHNFTLFSSIFTSQGKYLYEFLIIKIEEGYLLECEKKSTTELIKIFNFYKLRSKVNLTDVSKEYSALVISLEKFREINTSQTTKGFTVTLNNNIVYVDPRNEKLGAKIILKNKNVKTILKDLSLKTINKEKYYIKSHALGIPQINLDKLQNKIFGIENNLDKLDGIDFKKGCYIGQENTSRIKLRNKLRKRILPLKVISGKVLENDIIKYKDNEIGKIMIDAPYPFALIKIVDPDMNEFIDNELLCGSSKIKIFKPEWM
jgi:folate-binding protein YgfZ